MPKSTPTPPPLDARLAAALRDPASVRELDLRGSSSHKLTELPPDIGKLTNLEVLRLDDNALEDFPWEIEDLVELRELHASNNQIRAEGQAMYLRQLRVLNLHGNRLTEIGHGSSLGDFQRPGFEVQLGGNPIKFLGVAEKKLAVLGIDGAALAAELRLKKRAGTDHLVYPNVQQIHLYGPRLPAKEQEAAARIFPNAKLMVYPRVKDGPHLVNAAPIGAAKRGKPVPKPKTSRAAKLHREQAKALGALLAVARRAKVEDAFVREHARPCVDLETTVAKQPLKRASSRIGGAPDLPARMPWPKGSKGPMAFVAQIRLDEVARHDAFGLLPKTGMLSFFLGWEEDEGRVLYLPDVAKLHPVDSPAKVFVDGFADSPFRACSLSLRGTISLENLGGSEPDGWNEVMGRSLVLGKRDVVHRMFGYPFNDSDAVAPEQIVLLALGSDSKAKMTWGDDQERYFCIDRAELVKRRFDKVRIVPATS